MTVTANSHVLHIPSVKATGSSWAESPKRAVPPVRSAKQCPWEAQPSLCTAVSGMAAALHVTAPKIAGEVFGQCSAIIS